VHCTTSCKQSSTPEDGRNYRPKHVELIGIISKLLYVVGLYHCINDAWSYKHQMYMAAHNASNKATATIKPPLQDVWTYQAPVR